MVGIRKATAQDAWAIRRLIWKVGINPAGLNWRRFIVVIDRQDHLIGCGQVKPHPPDLRELASIAVEPAWQGQGIGRRIIEQLLGDTPLPLYLYCRKSLEPFYQQFGFQGIAPQNMPGYFFRIWKLVNLLRNFSPSFEGLSVMIKNRA